MRAIERGLRICVRRYDPPLHAHGATLAANRSEPPASIASTSHFVHLTCQRVRMAGMLVAEATLDMHAQASAAATCGESCFLRPWRGLGADQRPPLMAINPRPLTLIFLKAVWCASIVALVFFKSHTSEPYVANDLSARSAVTFLKYGAEWSDLAPFAVGRTLTALVTALQCRPSRAVQPHSTHHVQRAPARSAGKF